MRQLTVLLFALFSFSSLAQDSTKFAISAVWGWGFPIGSFRSHPGSNNLLEYAGYEENFYTTLALNWFPVPNLGIEIGMTNNGFSSDSKSFGERVAERYSLSDYYIVRSELSDYYVYCFAVGIIYRKSWNRFDLKPKFAVGVGNVAALEAAVILKEKGTNQTKAILYTTETQSQISFQPAVSVTYFFFKYFGATLNVEYIWTKPIVKSEMITFETYEFNKTATHKLVSQHIQALSVAVGVTFRFGKRKIK